jgi:diguanylate cyclase (GGDEF)-like protein/PAS domain S-box-containing protein
LHADQVPIEIKKFLQYLERSSNETAKTDELRNEGWRAWIYRLLVPGIYYQPDEARRAGTLNAFLLFSLVITNLFALVLMQGNPQPGMVLLTFLGASLLGVVSLIKLHQGHLRASASIYLAGIWFGVSLLAFFSLGGLSSSVIGAYLLILLAAGLFLNATHALVYAVASWLAITALYFAEANGRLPEPNVPISLEYSFYIISLVFVMGIVLVYLAARGIQEAMERASHHEANLQEKNLQLQAVLTNLEQLVAERTDEITHQKEFYQALVDNSPIAIVSLDSNQCILSCNPAFERLFGYSMGEACGQLLDGLIATPEDWLQAAAYTESILAGETINTTGQRKRKDGQTLEVEIYGVPVHVDGQRPGVLAMYHDVTDKVRAEEHLKHLATHDSLTMLPNRAMLYDHLGHALEIGRRNQTRVAIFFLDLDGFKSVNDLLGHANGDQLLQQVAGRLRQAIRKSDLVARIGGDEFAFVFENISSSQAAAVIAEKILNSLSEPFLIDMQGVSISGSIGVSLFPEDGQEPRQLLRNADAAMYRVKGRGKQDYQFFSRTAEQTRPRPELPLWLNLDTLPRSSNPNDPE